VSLVELLIVMAIVEVVTTGMCSLSLTDGVQRTRFTVTAVVIGADPGLAHVPGKHTSSAGGGAYTYPAATSIIYRVRTETPDPSVPPDGYQGDSGSHPRYSFASSARKRGRRVE
jgi:hypothetical protein